MQQSVASSSSDALKWDMREILLDATESDGRKLDIADSTHSEPLDQLVAACVLAIRSGKSNAKCFLEDSRMRLYFEMLFGCRTAPANRHPLSLDLRSQHDLHVVKIFQSIDAKACDCVTCFICTRKKLVIFHRSRSSDSFQDATSEAVAAYIATEDFSKTIKLALIKQLEEGEPKK